MLSVTEYIVLQASVLQQHHWVMFLPAKINRSFVTVFIQSKIKYDVFPPIP